MKAAPSAAAVSSASSDWTDWAPRASAISEARPASQAPQQAERTVLDGQDLIDRLAVEVTMGERGIVVQAAQAVRVGVLLGSIVKDHAARSARTSRGLRVR